VNEGVSKPIFRTLPQADMAPGNAMKTTEIHSSRLKTALYLCLCLGFVAFVVLTLKHAHRSTAALPDAADLRRTADGEFVGATFALLSILMAWMLIRPWRLVLDDEGFTLKGGYIRSPKKVFWRDIDHFYVFVTRRGTRVIGYNYKPGVREILPAIEPGPDKKLPTGWPMGTEDMVDKLNAYRLGDGR
jgi:hypothetical protein